MNDTPVISFRDFSFKYLSQAEPTLHNIDLDIREGEKTLIVGPSGSGKSTLGHCINGLIPFSYKGALSGSLRIAGVEASEWSIFELSKKVGTVLQDSDGQFVGLTVGEDIAFALENDAVPVPAMREKVDRAARMVDMEHHLLSSPYELSGGQKQRTSLAGIMIDDVDILLFDEPLANLDPATGKTAIEIIDEICKDTTKTVIIIEHRLEDVLHCGVDRIVVIDDGRIVGDMNADDLLCSPLLFETGIREPLYITAMKYAGIELSPAMRPGYITTIDMSGSGERLKAWQQSVQPESVPAAKPSILQMDGVSFSYDGDKKVLKNICFDITASEMVSIVGRNGAGKSTLAKLICGFIDPDEGSIYCSGEDIRDKTIRERADKIGFVMQNPNQMISQTLISDEVALCLRLRGVDEDEVTQRVRKTLEICGLAPFRTWPISALSYGQKKRVTIASLLILEPGILILDEPTAGQDFRHYSEIMRFLCKLNKSGMTIILITHDMHLMLEYTPRAIVLSDGEVVSDAPSYEVLTDETVIRRANLKETSLYTLAGLADLSNGTAFVKSFIDYEKRVYKR